MSQILSHSARVDWRISNIFRTLFSNWFAIRGSLEIKYWINSIEFQGILYIYIYQSVYNYIPISFLLHKRLLIKKKKNYNHSQFSIIFVFLIKFKIQRKKFKFANFILSDTLFLFFFFFYYNTIITKLKNKFYTNYQTPKIPCKINFSHTLYTVLIPYHILIPYLIKLLSNLLLNWILN